MPQTIKDISGRRFGRLVAVSRAHKPNPRRRAYWKCQCDCGSTTVSRMDGLLRGTTGSCGCLPSREYKDIAGRRYGRLTAVRRLETHQGKTQWICLCRCGQEATVRMDALQSGDIKSCGCGQNRNKLPDELEQYLFKRRTITPTGCWEWTQRRNPQGYGKISIGSKHTTVHRVAARLWLGYKPSRWTWVLHKCDNPPCFNPEHLFIGTPSDNTQDSVRKGRQKEIKKTHCPQGHPYSPENTMYDSNGKKRKCRICCRARCRMAWARRRAKVA